MVNIVMVQEVKITDPKYVTKSRVGYNIQTAAAGTVSCGGVTLLVRENDNWAFTA